MADSTHYVAEINVQRVDLTENRDRGSASHGEKRRKVGEVSKVIAKAPTMEALKQRVAGHMALIEDDVPLDERRTTRGD